MPEPQTLMTGLALGESPRWHEDRLWFSDWGAQEVIAVDVGGTSEVILGVPSLPFCIDWLPDGRLLIVSGREGHLLRREPDGSLVTHADLSGLSEHPWNDIVVDGRGNAESACPGPPSLGRHSAMQKWRGRSADLPTGARSRHRGTPLADRGSRLGRGPVASSVLSSPLSSRARRSLPLRRQSTPSARRRPATWRLRRGSPRR